MVEISNERWEELIEQMGPKQRAKLEADQMEASKLFIQRMRKQGWSEMIAGIVSVLKPEERLAGLNQEERAALRKLLDEQKD